MNRLLFWLLFPRWLGEVAARLFPRARNPGALLVVSMTVVLFTALLQVSGGDVIGDLVGLFVILMLAALVYGLMAWWFPMR